MQSLRILIITPCFFKYPITNYAGIEYICEMLANNLANLGHCVDVVCPIGSEFQNPNIEVIETVEPSNFNREDLQFAMLKQMPLDGYDIIHDHTHVCFIYEHPDADYLPITWTNHNPYPPTTHAPCKYMNIVAISEFQKNKLASYGLNAQVVYNGINPDLYEYKENKSDYVLFFSRLENHKGVQSAIDIAKRSGLKFIIAGSSFTSSLKHVEYIKRRCASEDIELIISPDNNKRKELFANAKCFLFPVYQEEPFGLVLVESQISGTPVIGRNRGAVSELILHNKTGYLADTDDEMLTYLEQIDSIKPIDCYNWSQNFTDEKMTQNYLKVYERIVQGERW